MAPSGSVQEGDSPVDDRSIETIQNLHRFAEELLAEVHECQPFRAPHPLVGKAIKFCWESVDQILS